MARFVDLPPELRVQIVSYLSPKDLAALARVNKGQVTVARERLYLSVEMNQPDEGHRLMSLLRTLFAHPELLQQIRSISLPIVDCILPYDKDTLVNDILLENGDSNLDDSLWCPQYQDARRNLCAALKQCGVDPDENRDWFRSLEEWYAVAFYGALLAVLPNLERVALSCYVKPYKARLRPATKHDDISNKMLGRNFRQGTTKLSPSVAQLVKVKELDFGVGHLSWNLIRIFDPLSLKLTSPTEMRLFMALPCLSRLNHIDVPINLADLFQNDQYGRDFSRSILAISNLKHIMLRLAPPGPYCHPQQYPACVASALADVEAGSASTLETLGILPHDTTRNTFFHNMLWIPNFSNFIRLRSLTSIHRPGIMGFKDTLPAILKELCLLCTASLGNVEIDDLVRHKLTFGNLQRLNVHFQNEYDANIESTGWDKFAKVKVDVCIHMRQHTLLRWIPA